MKWKTFWVIKGMKSTTTTIKSLKGKKPIFGQIELRPFAAYLWFIFCLFGRTKCRQAIDSTKHTHTQIWSKKSERLYVSDLITLDSMDFHPIWLHSYAHSRTFINRLWASTSTCCRIVSATYKIRNTKATANPFFCP